MNADAIKNRKENLFHLVKDVFKTQTALAMSLEGSGVTQSSISNLLYNKSSFYDFKARAIERYLSLPEGWMDKKGWIQSGGELIQGYWHLSPENRRLFNQAIDFAVKKSESVGQFQ